MACLRIRKPPWNSSFSAARCHATSPRQQRDSNRSIHLRESKPVNSTSGTHEWQRSKANLGSWDIWICISLNRRGKSLGCGAAVWHEQILTFDLLDLVFLVAIVFLLVSGCFWCFYQRKFDEETSELRTHSWEKKLPEIAQRVVQSGEVAQTTSSKDKKKLEKVVQRCTKCWEAQNEMIQMAVAVSNEMLICEAEHARNSVFSQVK